MPRGFPGICIVCGPDPELEICDGCYQDVHYDCAISCSYCDYLFCTACAASHDMDHLKEQED